MECGSSRWNWTVAGPPPTTTTALPFCPPLLSRSTVTVIFSPSHIQFLYNLSSLSSQIPLLSASNSFKSLSAFRHCCHSVPFSNSETMELRRCFSRASDHDSLSSSPVSDAFSLIRRTRVSWGSIHTRNHDLKPRRCDFTKNRASKPTVLTALRLIPRTRVSWGSKKSRNQASKPREWKAESVPIPPIRFSGELSMEEEIAVSGLLMLASRDPWTIKKVLTESDLNSQSRLLIGKILVLDHIISHLDDYGRAKIHSEDGLCVGVKDCDTSDVFHLQLKWRSSTTSYVLMHGWRRDFVFRRSLEKDDEIGLFWSEIDNMLVFSVLQRAPVHKSG